MKQVNSIWKILCMVVLGFYFQEVNGQCSPSATSVGICGSTYSRSVSNTSSWSPSSISGCSTSKTTRGEGSWSFTPSTSGNYPVYIASVSGTTSLPDFNVYMRQGSCGTTSLSCVGSRPSASLLTPAGTVFLVANQQYTFIVDWRQNTSPTSSITIGLRLGCPPPPPDPCDATATMSSCGTTYTRNLAVNDSWNGSTSGGCTSLGTTRGENTWRFTPTVSGNYPIYLASLSGSTTSSSYFNLFYRAGSCSNSTSGWTCIDYRTSASTSTPFGTVFLQAGTTYHFLVDWRRSTAPTADATVGLRVGCYTPPNPCSSTPPTLSVCSGTTTSRTFTGLSGNSSYQSYCSGYGYGEEYIYRFTTTAAGNYQINVTSVTGSGARTVAYKLKQGTICSSSGWTCLGSRSTSGTINMNNLAANTTYQLMLDAEQRDGNSFTHTFRIDCPPCSDIQSIVCGSAYQANLPLGTGAGWDIQSCNFQSTPGAEKMYYFVPSVSGAYDFNVTSATGTINYFIKDAFLGCNSSNWSCIGSVSAPGILTVNLVGGNPYYILADGTSSTVSANHRFVMECLDPCQGYTSIAQCGTPVIASVSASSGAGWMNACGPHTGAGKERVFEYTPQLTGAYAIQVTASNGPATYYFRPTSTGCGSTGWTCIDAMPTIGTSQTIALTAGVSYLFLFDSENPNSPTQQTFELNCAPHDPCLIPTSTLSCGQISTQIFPNGTGAGWNLQACPNSSGLGYEYLYSFTPAQSGTYDILVNSMTTQRNSFFVRSFASPCDTASYACIGTVSAPGVAGQMVLSANTTYTIAVVNDSTSWGILDFSIQGNTLQPVTALTVNNPTCFDVQLGWLRDTLASDFELDVATDSLFTQIVGNYSGFLMGLTDSFVVGNLYPATQYYFRVRPIYPCGTGSWTIVNGTTAGTPVNLVANNNGPLCVGTSTTLSLTATSNFTGPYNWYNPSTTISGSQNVNLSPVFLSYAGVWTVEVFTPNCGWVEGYTTVVVYDNPSTVQVGSNSPVCINGTLQLSAQTRPNATYSWVGPNGFTSNLQNPVLPFITAADTGLYSLTVSVPSCNSATLTTQVSLAAPPSISLSTNSPVCSGGSTPLTLNATTITGAGYFWSGPGGYTSVSQNISISNPTTQNSGVYTLVVTDLCGNQITDTLSASVIPGISNPSAVSNSPLCVGAGLNLSASTHNGASYAWSGPNGFTSSSQYPSIPNMQTGDAGQYSVEITLPGCATTTVSTTVVVQTSLSITIGSNSPVCDNGQGSLSLTAPFVNSGVYSWTGPNGFTSSQQNPILNNITQAGAGMYYLSVTGSCGSATDSTLVVVNAAPVMPQISVNSPVCTGATLNLSGSTHTGASYSWAGPNGYTATGQFVSRSNSNGTFAGTYSMTVSVSGCPSQTISTPVQILALPQASATANGPLCSGSTLNLSAGNVTGAQYAWSGPNGFTSGVQNPSIPLAGQVNAGMYYVTVTNSCGSALDSVSVNIATAPSNPSITTNAPVCAGATLNLSGSTHTGASYSWAGPNGYTASGQFVSRSNVSLNDAGTYSLTVSLGNCPTASTQTNVQILTTPTATATSNSPVCTGGILLLNAATINGAQYAWAGPNGFTSALQNPSLTQVNPSQTGVYTLTVTSSGCGSTTSTTSVQIGGQISNIQASSNSPICQGGALILSATSVAGVTYTWSGPQGYSSALNTDTIQSVTTSRSGVYTLTVSSPGCGSTQLATSVIVNSTPSPSPGSNSPICAGNALFLTANSITGAQYQWTGPAGYSSSLQSPALSNANSGMSGVYTLTATVPGCGVFTGTTSVSVNASPSQVQVSSNSPVCQGGTLGLSATSLPGVSYQWSGPVGFTATGSVASASNVQLNQAGLYSLVATAPGCASSNLTMNVVVNPATPLNAGSNSPVCSGSVLQLSAASIQNASYAWSGPNGFNSSAVSPTISNVNLSQGGVYTLTVTQGGCGISSGTVSVTVGSPVTGITAWTNSPVCSGNTLQLSATALSGVTYAWNAPSGFSSSNRIDSVVNILSGGMYSLTVSSPGCPNAVVQTPVTVNASVPSSPGTVQNPICSGGVLYLTANSANGATYLWTGPNGFSSTLQNPSLSGIGIANSGVYSLQITVPGCVGNQGTTNVSIGTSLAGLTAVSNSPVCVGNTIYFSTQSRSGVSYQWSGPNGFTSASLSDSIVNITNIHAGNYSLTVSSPGCGSQVLVAKVIVNNPGTITASNNGPLCAGGVLNLFVTGVSGYTYQWTGPSGFQSTVQNPVITNVSSTQSGIYSVVVTVPNCGGYSVTTSVQIGAPLNGITVTANNPVCAGGNLNLSCTAITGATYAWSGPNGFTSSLQNPTVSNVTQSDAGVYSVTVSTAGCNAIVRTISVSISPGIVSLPGSNTPICQGGVVYFTSNTVSGATYSWTGPNGFVSTMASPSILNVQPLSSGTYTLTITQSGCGSAVGTTVLQVGSSTTAAQVLSNSPVCVGADLRLSVNNLSSGNVLWTGPAGFTSNQTIISRNPAQVQHGGIYTVLISSPGCTNSTRTMSVAVNNISVNAGSNSPICQGGVLQLSVNAISGATYNWTGPNSFVSSMQNPSISNAQPIRTGIYTLTVNSQACGALSSTVSVQVGSTLSSITVTGNSPACVGGNLNLSVTNRVGYTYNWTGPNGFTSTQAFPVVSGLVPQSAGRYSVVVTSLGCGVTTVQSNTMLVNNPASVTASVTTPACVGTAVYFTGNAPTGSTYSWSGPAGFATTSQSPARTNIQLSHAGNYTLTANVPGCGPVQAIAALVVNPCRITNLTEEDEIGNLEVYPNPFSESIHLNSTQGKILKVEMMDIQGKAVVIQEVSDLNSTITLPTGELPAGTYLLKVTVDGDKVYLKKVIKN